MKKTSILIIIVGIVLAACFKTENAPPLEFNGKANMTIADFFQFHELSPNNPATLIEENVIITGIVTSTDKYGSSYKEIYFQDETGGLCIRTSNTSYYNKYRIGQRIYVKAKGLYLENYVSGTRTGYYQLGLFGGDGGTQYLSAKVENQHVFRDGYPEAKPLPKIISRASDIDKNKDFHTLVKLTNCYFSQANGTTKYFEESGTSTTISRTVKFNMGGGNDMVEARISKYCNFANDTLPEGALNIEGILTMFGSNLQEATPQLIICSVNDVETIPPAKTLINFDMKTDPFTQGWTNKQFTGETAWFWVPNNAVMIQTPTKETKCWLISPKFNFAGEKDVALFFTYRFLNGGTSDNVQVQYTLDGTNWNPLLDFMPQTGTAEAVLKLDEHISSNPNLQIAFCYKTTTVFPTWAIMNIECKANVLQ